MDRQREERMKRERQEDMKRDRDRMTEWMKRHSMESMESTL